MPVSDAATKRELYKQYHVGLTDFNKPTHELIEEIRDELIKARCRIHDIMHGIGWEDELIDVEGLINCGLSTLYHVKKEIINFHIKSDDKKFGPSYAFNSRGIGRDVVPDCFVCGSNRPPSPSSWKMMNNIAAFIDTVANGITIVELFDGLAWLDFREFEPNYIQVKIGACDKHVQNLQRLHDLTKTYGVIRMIDINNAKSLATIDKNETA